MNKNLVCDFCSGTPVVTRYEANSFVVEAFSTKQLTQESVGDWAACAECERLIDLGDWDGVTSHAVDKFFEKYPHMKDAAMRDYIWSDLRRMYNQLVRSGFRKGKL